jgi:hypothetical protein
MLVLFNLIKTILHSRSHCQYIYNIYYNFTTQRVAGSPQQYKNQLLWALNTIRLPLKCHARDFEKIKYMLI